MTRRGRKVKIKIRRTSFDEEEVESYLGRCVETDAPPDTERASCGGG